MNEATREILWNANSLANVIAMYATFAFSVVIGFNGIFRKVELWAGGKPSSENLGNWSDRFFTLFDWGMRHKGVVREKSVAVAHSLLYIGFIALLFATTMVFIDHDLGIRIYKGKFYLAVTILSDVLGFAALVGCAMLAKRRYFSNTKRLHNNFADFIALAVIALLIVQGFSLEGLRIHATNDPWALYSPIGLVFAKFFWFLSYDATTAIHFLMWWFHTLTVFIVIALLPYTKAFHIIASPINLYFKNSNRAKGELKSPGDIEELIEKGEDFSLGLDTIKDYSWKQLMDLDSCTSCGRCQSVCPAYNSGKQLSPKWLILDTRNHASALNASEKMSKSIMPNFLVKIDKFLTEKLFLKSSGVRKENDIFKADGEYRGDNVKIHDSINDFGADAEQVISGGVLNPETFWACTTCYACVDACPVGINHVDQIIENRRNMVLMKGEVPTEAQTALKMLESQFNPFGPAEDRTNWMEGLDVPILKEGDEVDYLYWVGCVSSFDSRKQKIAQSLVKIMNNANVSFGIMGNVESCTGDPARRLGEENLFQMLVKQNIKNISKLNFKTIVTNCPHCFNTLKNEYPEFGTTETPFKPEVMHHSVLIEQLMKEDKIKLKTSKEEFTFHDPCYLGRYNDEYEAPRSAVKKASGLKILEMEESGNKAKCCGAGGGHFWMDMKEGERINVQRTEQAMETGAKNIATACPFCMQMLEDGVKIKNLEEELRVRDIAEVVAEQLID